MKRGEPTLKQIKTLQFINQGMSKRAAMLKAGYTVNTARNPGANLTKKKGVRNALLGMVSQLQDAGLTSEYMVAKFKEWLEAEKRVGEFGKFSAPDYEIQLKAYDRWKEVVREQAMGGSGRNVKRKLTIEEFIAEK